MNQTLTIRSFEAGDLARLHRIREAAFKPVFASFRNLLGETIAGVALAGAEREQAELLDRLCATSSPDRVFVAEADGEIVGFCAMSLDRDARVGEIGLNAVHPDHQGKGIGTVMYDHVLARMREDGMSVATVGTGGDASHAPARRAYEKAGFGPAIPNVYMYRSL
ncbi:MAG: GNAT family N-acetyltransferase [Pseudomonadota bacterium]